jgi:adenine C2-methylase RlmN of 23S rRNA A2503 and tRNA A37
MGLRGNLTCGEILEQLVHANVRARVRNIVFMGMGEPLNNYEQVRRGVNERALQCLIAVDASHTASHPCAAAQLSPG